MTLTDATELVAVMQTYWPNHPWHDKADLAYHRGLSDLDYATVNAALDKAIQTCKFAPTVAELRELIGANDDGMGDAEVEWGNVLSEIRRVHVYKAPVFANPATEAATRAMGWEGLCLMEQDDVIANRAHFFRIYAAHAKQIKQRRLHEIASGVTPIGSGSPKEIAS